MNNRDGGPVYPVQDQYGDDVALCFKPHTGMTMRQYYKVAALQGLLSAQIHGFNDTPAKGPFVQMASDLADAMLQEDLNHE